MQLKGKQFNIVFSFFNHRKTRWKGDTHTHRHTRPNIFGQTASDWISVWKSITWLHHVRACVPRNHLINPRPHIKVPAHTHQACRCGHGDNSDTINDVRLCFRWPAAEGGKKKKKGLSCQRQKRKNQKWKKFIKSPDHFTTVNVNVAIPPSLKSLIRSHSITEVVKHLLTGWDFNKNRFIGLLTWPTWRASGIRWVTSAARINNGRQFKS